MKFPLLVLLVICAFCKITTAQTITIGAGSQSGTSSNGATGDPGPMYRSSATSNFVYSRHHYLYTTSELTGLPAGAVITEVAWYKDNVAGSNANFLFEVYMKNSSLTTVQTPPQTWATLTTGSTQVYSSSASAVASPVGWVAYTLSTPFIYTGGGLEISVNFDMSSGTSPWTSAGFSWQKDPITGRTISYCGSSANTTLSNARTVRPRLRITYQGTPCTSPPTAGTVTKNPATTSCAGSPVTLGLSGNSSGAGQSYQWQSSAASGGPFTNVGTAGPLPGITVNPTVNTWYRCAVTCGTSTVNTAAVQVTIGAALAGGTYTINKTLPTGGTNFNSFNAAVDAMKTCGITGPVTFNVATNTYTESIPIPTIPNTSATRRVTFQSATGNPANVTVNFTGSTTTNFIFQLTDASFITIKNMTITGLNAANSRLIDIVGNSSNDSIINCILSGPTTTTNSTNSAKIHALNVTGNNNVIKKVSVTNGSYGIYIEADVAIVADGWVIDSNTITNANNYSLQIQNMLNVKCRYNTISTTATATHYGIYTYDNNNAVEIIGNKITMTGATGTKYGIYQYYNAGTSAARGTVANNVIRLSSTSATAHGLKSHYCDYQRIHNNTVNITSTSATGGIAGYFYYTTSYNGNEIRNNILSNTGGGYAMYVYSPAAATSNNHSFDYNNLYTSGTKLVDQGTPATDYANIKDWRTASGQDKNSISYPTGLTSTTNLVPDPANASSWSINGRGIHIPGNDKDITGSPRVTTLAAGVPDIGAYEFVPTAIPPSAIATPAIPAPGSTQTFEFGSCTVATIDWPNNVVVPTTIDVKQYTGTVAPQLTAISPSSYMYSYADINTPAGLYNYTVNLHYKDPWLGTIASEANMKMTRKLGTTGDWFAYNFSESNTDATENVITTSKPKEFGYFTGIDNDIILSAHITTNRTVICPGGNTTLNANNGPGYTFQWQYNGNDIPGATLASYIATQPGSYTVKITRASITRSSDPLVVTTINPPPAQITTMASVFCPGNSLSLFGNQGTGLSYQWQLNGADITGEDNDTLVTTTAGVYTLVVTNAGCATISASINITTEPLPMPTINPDNSVTICDGDSLLMYAQTPPSGLPFQYQWRKDAIDIAGANGSSFNASIAGNYSVLVYSGACPIKISPGTELYITPAPTPSITATGQYLQTGVYNTYQWYHNTQLIPGATTFAYYATQTGDYTVEVDNGDCPGMSPVFNLSTLGIDDINKGNAIKVYPNPASAQLFIDAPFDVNIDLVTVDGRMVISTTQKAIDISGLATGFYMVKISDRNGMVVKMEKIFKNEQ